jgi:hypothetical protein
MKNIVIITREYYPQMTPVSAVVDKYIQRMKGAYNFHVICTSYGEEAPPQDEPYVHIYPVSTYMSRLRGKYEKRYSSNRNNLFYKFVIALFRARSAFWLMKSYSAPTKWEYEESYKQLLTLSMHIKIDVVVSVSGSLFHAHLAAKKYKENHPQTKWLTFITDPITFLDSNFFLFKSKKMMEKSYETELSIYNSADYNILVGDTYYDVIDKFKQPKSKTFHFNLTLDDIRKEISGYDYKPTETSDTRIIYAGKFYRKIRNPDYMLSIMSQIQNIEFDLFVSSHECLESVVQSTSDTISVHDSVDTSYYKEMICNKYDILLNVGNKCTNQMPSKMLEYLSTGRPIINFFYNKDSQYEMIEKYPLGLNIGRYDSDAVYKVQTFCNEMRGKQLNYEEVETIFPECKIDNQVDIFKSLINS